MGKLINADSLKRSIRKDKALMQYLDCGQAKKWLMQIIDEQSEITAKWTDDGHCTECGEHAPYWAMASTYYKSNYCPNCGRKMLG